ncbi:uncharacterized protein METZ01_LOCUS385711 [marine metagenome]|uniref:Uncharacterized protein n=1 Tax=marine metagenome TaxID=408172 RepID=A0A382UFN1_9ZZZZ
MTNKTKPLFAAYLVGLLALAAFDASAAVAPHPPEEMMEEATHVVRGKVVALTSKTQKSKVERGLLIARDRIFKITLELTKVDKGKRVKEGDQLTFEAWQPSTRFPAMPGPQGHQPVPDKGDIVKTYLLYDKKTKTYHPFMPNGIEILKQAKKGQ